MKLVHKSFANASGILCMSGMLAVVFLLMACLGMAQPPKALAIINAGSGATVVAPGSIAAAFGSQIGASTHVALSLPLPTLLNGVSIDLTDSAMMSQMASLFFVSPNQINSVIPDSVALGMTTAKIMGGNNSGATASMQVANVAPGLFTVNGAGTGVAAALAIRRIIATQTDVAVPVFHCDANGCVSEPIDMQTGTQLFLELFGTGVRRRTALSNVSVTIGGEAATVLFAGAQGQFPGLDQVNVMIPNNHQRHGEQDLVITVDGQVANAGRVNIR